MAVNRLSDGEAPDNQRVLANGQRLDLTPLLTLRASICAALARVQTIQRRIDDRDALLRALAMEGVDFARPAYLGKYLYRSVPREAGRKGPRRLYVGAAGAKADAALACMNRGHRYVAEVAALRALLAQLARVQRPATQLLEHLEVLTGNGVGRNG